MAATLVFLAALPVFFGLAVIIEKILPEDFL